MSRPLRPHVVLKLHKRIHGIIAFAGHVVQSMTDNPSFPSPTPSLAAVQADLDALTRAQSNVLSRTLGAATARDACLATVRLDLLGLGAYVQSLTCGVDMAAAAALVASSGFALKRRGVRPKQRAAAIPGPVSGAVRLTAPFAGKRAAYEWQTSEEEGPWSDQPVTMRASMRRDALTPGRVYRFRVRARSPKGMGEWSEPVTFRAL